MIRLKGNKLKELNNYIYFRDFGECALCHSPVPEGTKAHHVIEKSHCGSDSKDNLVMLCLKCHHDIHFTDKTKVLKERCKQYLQEVEHGDNDRVTQSAN